MPTLEEQMEHIQDFLNYLQHWEEQDIEKVKMEEAILATLKASGAMALVLRVVKRHTPTQQNNDAVSRMVDNALAAYENATRAKE